MSKYYLTPASSLIGLSVCLLASCQTTHSALPAGGGFGSFAAAPVAARPVLEEPAALVASVSEQPTLPAASNPQKERVEGIGRGEGSPHYSLRPATGLQTSVPDTLPAKQPEARREFGVTQIAHIGGGLLVLSGGASVINGLNSDSTGYYPLAAIGFGIILAVIGGAMLLFKGKTARRRRKEA